MIKWVWDLRDMGRFWGQRRGFRDVEGFGGGGLGQRERDLGSKGHREGFGAQRKVLMPESRGFGDIEDTGEILGHKGEDLGPKGRGGVFGAQAGGVWGGV